MKSQWHIREAVPGDSTGLQECMESAYSDYEERMAGGRAFQAAGLKPDDIVVHCLNYCMWSGGFTDHQGLEAAGASVAPYGVGNSSELIETILSLSVTAIVKHQILLAMEMDLEIIGCMVDQNSRLFRVLRDLGFFPTSHRFKTIFSP
jgi:phenylacetate-coenzyme A ligase PaaK-like adenylate-forming protein